MPKKLRIVLAQLNLVVGDIDGNVKKHIEAARIAKDQFQADIIVFPELSITGYPPEDLLLRNDFLADSDKGLQTLLTQITDIYCLIGHPISTPKGLLNACSLIYNHKIIAQYAKQQLPNYDVFDEDRYFIPGTETCVVLINDISVGIVICEDLWTPEALHQTVLQGAQIIISPNASPFETDKHEKRLATLKERTKEHAVPIVYVNMVGGQDELVFDGGSIVINETGELCQLAHFFKEHLLCVDFIPSITKASVTVPQSLARIYDALVLSVHDYIKKNHFPGVLIGLSGGIDSALTLKIAVDALGKDKVQTIIMPSNFTADISIEDAKTLANNLSVKYETISIEYLYQTFLTTLNPFFADKNPDTTEENIQARIRAILLMALSNKFGSIVLITSNRSELAVGYSTLYGDMAGGFAVLKDIPKTMVYKLAEYCNQKAAVIPRRIIERPPTAELALNQKDEDSLPPYPVLDKLLEAYLNQGLSLEQLVAAGFPRETVNKIIKLIRYSEYKRRQTPVGPRINMKAFGKDWRFPITNGFKG